TQRRTSGQSGAPKAECLRAALVMAEESAATRSTGSRDPGETGHLGRLPRKQCWRRQSRAHLPGVSYARLAGDIPCPAENAATSPEPARAKRRFRPRTACPYLLPG